MKIPTSVGWVSLALGYVVIVICIALSKSTFKEELYLLFILYTGLILIVEFILMNLKGGIKKNADK